MIVLAAFPILVGLAVAGTVFGVRLLRRKRRIRKIESAEVEVVTAVDDGRLARQTGEILLQHLEGLRRECFSGDGV